jgi:deferrochelatase/peroxidase EfeB
MSSPASDREDIQGLILSGYGHMPHAALLLLRITDAKAAREWLGRRVPEVRSAAPWLVEHRGKPKTAINLAFTWTGMKGFELPPETLGSFPKEFYFGMAERKLLLRDLDDSDPRHWEFGNDERPVDGMLAMYATSEDELERLVARQRADLGTGVEELLLERGRRPATLTEPFGFRDGVSQPAVGTLQPPRPHESNTVAAGAFVLGHPDPYDVLPPTPAVPKAADPADALPPFPGQPRYRDLGRNGSYLVYRKLEQDVAGFWNSIEELAHGDPEEMIFIASKLFGRWPSGTSLVESPHRDDIKRRKPSNSFLYLTDDDRGYSCPVGGHVRRMNPRDALSQLPADEALKTTDRHRMLRRGIPYGEPLFSAEKLKHGKPPIGLKDDGQPRGLHFFAVIASISSQFEMVSEQWGSNRTFEGLYDTEDPILGKGTMVIQATPCRRKIADRAPFITLKGGGYFFVPSMTALRFISSL